MKPPFTLGTCDLRPSLPFQDWKRNVHSQSGEDGILERLLEAIGASSGYFIEFGAWDGQHLSNCALLAEKGFAGCFIEGDRDRFTALLAAYPGRSDIVRVNALVRHEGPDRLDAILARAGVPRDATVLSIDIDGMDYHVWDSLTHVRPTLCIIEFNPTIPAHVIFAQARDDSVHQGCSIGALYELAISKNYALVAATEFNAIFMDEAVRAAHKVTSYLPDQVKSRTHETAFFHGFDGQVFLAGDRTLLWHGIEIDPEAVQILPADLRQFPVGVPDSYHQRLAPYRDRRR